MKVLVDTSVWSLALRRRKRPDPSPVRAELTALIQDGRAVITGPVRQELLSGAREPVQHERLRDHMRAFPDVELTTDDFEEAAFFYNLCRERGVQGSNTDFLICAISARNDFAIFTTDGDFERFAKVLPIRLHAYAA